MNHFKMKSHVLSVIISSLILIPAAGYADSQDKVGNPAIIRSLSSIDSGINELQSQQQENDSNILLQLDDIRTLFIGTDDGEEEPLLYQKLDGIARVLDMPEDEEEIPGVQANTVMGKLDGIASILQSIPEEEEDPPQTITGKLNAISDRLGAIEQNQQEILRQLSALGEACGTEADLKPVPVGYPAPSGYCRLDAGNLLVRVANVGGAPAGASTLRVIFNTSGGEVAVEGATPALNAGDSADVAIPMPSGCYTPDCTFSIGVDAYDDVIESVEPNNSDDGLCLG